MIIPFQYNENNSQINIGLTSKIGIIEQYILETESLLIYNIQYIRLFYNNNEYLTFGDDNCLFSETFLFIFLTFHTFF